MQIKPPPHAKNLRQGRVSLEGYVYSITKCQNKKINKQLIDFSGLPEKIIESFLFCQKQGWCQIAAFTIMPDHFHLVLRLGNVKTLSELMHSICSFTFNFVPKEHGLSCSLWDNGFFDHAVRSDESMEVQMNYIEDNPVRAGLVEDQCEWVYSSAHKKYCALIDRSWLY